MWQEGEMMRISPGLRPAPNAINTQQYHQQVQVQTPDAVEGRPGQAAALLARRHGQTMGPNPVPVTPDASIGSSTSTSPIGFFHAQS
jgi:hypothetical protein